MHFLPEVWQFMSKISHGLIHIWLVGEPHQAISSFSMFHIGRELEHFTTGQNKYNEMENITKFLLSAVEMCVDWEI